MTRKESIIYCNDENNNVTKYLRHMIINDNSYHADKRRTQLHCDILRDFGFDVTEKTIERSKHIFANIPRIFSCYLSSVGDYITKNFMMMMTLKYVDDEKRLNQMSRFVSAFLTEEKTKKFINNILEPYNDISIYDYVFVCDIMPSSLHDYYSIRWD